MENQLWQEYEKRGILSGVSSEVVAEWQKDWQEWQEANGTTSQPVNPEWDTPEWDAESLEDIKNCPF